MLVAILVVGRDRRGSVRAVGPASATRSRLFGLVVALAAPLGDLCESLIKRDLGVKDMGDDPARPRRRARPLRRAALRPPGRLLPRPIAASSDPAALAHAARRVSIRRETGVAWSMTTRVALAGSTGSIGTQTLDVVRGRARPLRGRRARRVVVGRPAGRAGRRVPAEGRGDRRRVARGRARRTRCPTVSRCAPGPTRWRASRPTPTSSSTASSASPACRSRWPTLEAGRRLALANKESLIAAGPVVQRARRPRAPSWSRSTASTARSTSACGPATAGDRARSPASCSPPAAARSAGRTRAELADVTVDDALAHPTWTWARRSPSTRRR